VPHSLDSGGRVHDWTSSMVGCLTCAEFARFARLRVRSVRSAPGFEGHAPLKEMHPDAHARPQKVSPLTAEGLAPHTLSSESLCFSTAVQHLYCTHRVSGANAPNVERTRTRRCSRHPKAEGLAPRTLSSEYGTCKTVKARFWPWLCR